MTHPSKARGTRRLLPAGKRSSFRVKGNHRTLHGIRLTNKALPTSLACRERGTKRGLTWHTGHVTGSHVSTAFRTSLHAGQAPPAREKPPPSRQRGDQHGTRLSRPRGPAGDDGLAQARTAAPTRALCSTPTPKAVAAEPSTTPRWLKRSFRSAFFCPSSRVSAPTCQHHNRQAPGPGTQGAHGRGGGPCCLGRPVEPRGATRHAAWIFPSAFSNSNQLFF